MVHADNKVDVYWDTNKVAVPWEQDIDTLKGNMNSAVRNYNRNYVINRSYFCGETPGFEKGFDVICHVAKERYCLCDDCSKSIAACSDHVIFSRGFDLDVMKGKYETPDVWLTRMMYKDRRRNVLGRFPESGNVVLLVSADFDFKRTMMDLKTKGCTVLLALPEDANQDFVTGFDAAWHVSSLVLGGDRI